MVIVPGAIDSLIIDTINNSTNYAIFSCEHMQLKFNRILLKLLLIRYIDCDKK